MSFRGQLMAKNQPAVVAAFESFWGWEGVDELLVLPSCPEVCFSHWLISVWLHRVTRDDHEFCVTGECQVL